MNIGDHRALHGVMAEFRTADELLRAVRSARDAGYAQMEAYAPYPVEGLTEALGRRHSRLPGIILVGGVTGAATAYAMQYYAAVVSYPINIGGRPLHSWPMFIPVTFELTILFSALTALFAMVLLNGLPRLHHPVFSGTSFERASQDRFFLVVESGDSKFDATQIADFFRGTSAISVEELREE